MNSTLRKNIIETIIYYDIFDFPLTPFEIWKYLLSVANNDKSTSFSLGEIVEELDNSGTKDCIDEFRGFYFVRGRKELVARRIQNDKNSIEKYRIASRAAKWLRYVPFVRMAAMTGTVAMKNCEKASDIDFFVTTGKGRIFTARLLVTATVHILGLRRHGKKIRNRICLNYFVSEENLEIKDKNLFAAGEYSFLYPLYGFDCYRKFGAANIGWIKAFRPNFAFEEIAPFRYVADGRLSKLLRGAAESLINILGGDRIESWLKKGQIARIEKNPLTKKKGAYIEATDENLIFLPEPQSAQVEKEFRKRINS